MAESVLVFLLLPVAALSGWWIGRAQTGQRQRNRSNLSSQYFRGLNYLLNEEPDKAIETFTRLAEINRDTVDTHLALGTLFRRRGEMDKAIRYHKHIISRPNLEGEQRERVLFELALDYMRAGLLDRAERLFLDLTDSALVGTSARKQLLDIYEQTKDWSNALEQAEHLDLGTPGESVNLIAQLRCELAQAAWDSGDTGTARSHLRQARRYEPENARARLIEAGIVMEAGQNDSAADLYREACELDPDLLVSHFARILRAHERAAQSAVLMEWLRRLHEQSGIMAPALAWARLKAQADPRAAASYLLERLEHRPTVRGLEFLMRLLSEHETSIDQVSPVLIRDLTQRLLQGQPTYRCRQCGFSGGSHHWMCPSCRSWNTTRVIHGVLGE